jgi:catechol 2,3-dioxygenase-like lactoylglutathione lyase family enzyme
VCAVEAVEIILTVPSIEHTVAWYERVLGWTGHYDTFDAEGRCVFGSVVGGEGPKGFNLSRAPKGSASYGNDEANFTAFIKVDDVNAVHARVMGSGVVPDGDPEDQLWGGRSFSMREVNGFALTFWQEVEEVSLEEIRRRSREALGDPDDQPPGA